jgi:Mg2+/Co2+ transporter CorB
MYILILGIILYSVVNIGATAIVTEAATAMFGEAGVSAATGVMTVCHPPHTGPLI